MPEAMLSNSRLIDESMNEVIGIDAATGQPYLRLVIYCKDRSEVWREWRDPAGNVLCRFDIDTKGKFSMTGSLDAVAAINPEYVTDELRAQVAVLLEA